MGEVKARTIGHLASGGVVAITEARLYLTDQENIIIQAHDRSGMIWVGCQGSIAWVRHFHRPPVEMRAVDAENAQSIVDNVIEIMRVGTSLEWVLEVHLRHRRGAGWKVESHSGRFAIIRKDPDRPIGLGGFLWSLATKQPERLQLRVADSGVIIEERLLN